MDITKILIAAVAVIFLSSCSGGARKSWGSYGKEADSINAQLDSIYRSRGISIGDTVLTKHLAQSARNPEDCNLKALVDYWNAHALRVNFPDSAARLTVRAIRLCDSARAPYLASRIRLEEAAMAGPDLRRRYVALRDLLDYYKSIRDTAMTILAYRQLGSFHLDIHDLESYRECNEKAERLYLLTGNDSLAAKIRMNFALYHILQGDSTVAAAIIKKLLKDPYIRKDPVFMGRLYVNIAGLLHDPDSMTRAIEISPEFRNDLSKRLSLEFYIARMLDERGDTHRCDSMLGYLRPIIMEAGDHDAKKKLYAILSKRCKAAGDARGALAALEKSCDYADTMMEQERASGIEDYIHRDEVRRIDVEYERQKYAARIRWISLMLAGMLVAAMVCFWFWDRHRKTQLARAKAERDLAQTNLSLEREKRSLMAIGVVMAERDNLMKDVGKALDDMGREGRISFSDKRSISQMIKLSENSRQELESFKDTYEKVHPDFLKKLSERFPGLSEGDVRLALHISAGLSSKQIAQVMHIKLDSVKKNRQRLRKHLGLDSSVSLEETLRNML